MYTAKSDVYSFGILLWELFSGGATPFGDMTATDAFRAVSAGHRLPRPRASSQDGIVQLIRDTTASDVQSRPTMHTVHQILQTMLKRSTPDHVGSEATSALTAQEVETTSFVSRKVVVRHGGWMEMEGDLETSEL